MNLLQNNDRLKADDTCSYGYKKEFQARGDVPVGYKCRYNNGVNRL